MTHDLSFDFSCFDTPSIFPLHFCNIADVAFIFRGQYFYCINTTARACLIRRNAAAIANYQHSLRATVLPLLLSNVECGDMSSFSSLRAFRLYATITGVSLIHIFDCRDASESSNRLVCNFIQ